MTREPSVVVPLLVVAVLGLWACDSRQDAADEDGPPDVPSAADLVVGDDQGVDETAPVDLHVPTDIPMDDDAHHDSAPMDEGTDVNPDPGADDTSPDVPDTAIVEDPGVPPTDAPDVMDDVPVYQPCDIRPVLFVHGINGNSGLWQTMAGRLEQDGWPAATLYFFDAEDPSWGCNVDNADAIKALVDQIKDETGSDRVDIVAHSMGTISSRYYIKNLGGTDSVNTYVTLGGMHHGLFTPCLSPEFVRMFVCVWMELCQSGDFIAELNADPATPGLLHWVSMYGTADETVPNSSSHLDGAENIVFEGVTHDGDGGLLEVQEVYEEVRRVLEYPCW